MKMATFLLGACWVISSANAVANAQGRLDDRVGELSQQIAKEMADNQKKTIAVIEFVDLKGNVTDFGRYLAEKLITKLYQTKKFKVIERQLLNRVIAEQKLNLTGTIDPSSAKQLGKLLGVDAICSGTISDLAQTLDVNGRLISTETGEIFAVASTEIPKDDSVTRLLGDVSAKVPISEGPSKTKSIDLPAPMPKPSARFTAKEFVFEATSCHMAANNLTCDFSVESKSSNERLLVLYLTSTRMYDDRGNEYQPSKMLLGNRANTPEGVGLVVVPNVVTKGSARFDNINHEVTSVSLLRIVAADARPDSYNIELWGNQFVVTLKDIPVMK